MTPSVSRASQRVAIARTTLLLDQPFFGVLALQLALQEDPTCETAWTNGRTLGFNPAFIETLDQDQLTGLIAHEVMHCACGHPWRRDARDSDGWNVACDYAINQVLVDSGFVLPEGGLLDSQYTGKSSEWIYDRLPKPQPKAGGDPQAGDEPQGDPQAGDGPQGKPQAGEVRDSPASVPGDADPDMTESDWQAAVQQSAKAAHGRGKLPGTLARLAADLVAPRVDWRAILRRFLQATSAADYSWQQPNRRYLSRGLFLPSLHSEALGVLAVAVDTSGSIDDVLLSQFSAEIQAIADEMKPEAIEVLYCDTQIHKIERFERGEEIKLAAIGRGGTSFVPVFEHFDSSDVDQPVALVYLTDLEGAFPDSAPSYPVLWVTPNGETDVPFGECISCA